MALLWTPGQRAVIDTPPGRRQLVLAGPGTGKTATACATVGSRIKQGVPATKILLLSFTRTAVAELKARIASYLPDPGEMHSVRITTLDSETWSLCHGFGTDDVKKLFGDYDANIQKILERLEQRDALLLEYLEGFQHLIVDEAQDIVGVRARLVAALIQQLSPGCGVTVFADPAQSIYGFANDDDANGSGERLLDLLPTSAPGKFEEVSLDVVHRTNSPNLLTIFQEARQLVLRPSQDAWLNGKMRSAIEANADAKVQRAHEEPLDSRDSLLVLFRRRAEALMCSSQLSAEGVQHRLRLSGVPPMIHPWIGHVLGTTPTQKLTRDDFDGLWRERLDTALMERDGADAAWALLRELAPGPRESVDLALLRNVLGRARPPVDACLKDVGYGGPTVGTIHASKGREADEVMLYLPPEPSASVEQAALEEETRVLFVGATRARRRLLVGRGSYLGDKTIDASGRCYRVFRDQKRGGRAAQIEIGREHDVDVFASVDASTVSEDDAARAQTVLAASANRMLKVTARASASTEWTYVLALADDPEELPLGRMCAAFTKDLWTVANEAAAFTGMQLRPPSEFGQLTLHGCRTVALPMDSPHLERLHEPWRSSGLFLAPVVRGFSMIYFYRYGGRRHA